MASMENVAHALGLFVVPLRLGAGVNQGALDELCAELEAYLESLRSFDAIPKIAVSVFLEIWPAIDGCLSLYTVQEQQKVLAAAVRLHELIRKYLES